MVYLTQRIEMWMIIAFKNHEEVCNAKTFHFNWDDQKLPVQGKRISKFEGRKKLIILKKIVVQNVTWSNCSTHRKKLAFKSLSHVSRWNRLSDFFFNRDQQT